MIIPLYTYQCNICNSKNTHIRKVEESHISIKCDKCLTGIEHRIFDASNTSFELKGKWFKNTGAY
jgi:putative FmdB family regulatory protein